MKKITLPKNITVAEEEKGIKAMVIIKPCFSGYGLTLGNALRRVMLSSLPGGAVTAVKINGVGHEFSTIDNVSEDVVDIILNLKQLRFKIHSDEPVILKLRAKGEKKVIAADIEASSDVDIINSDLVIATLNDKDAKLEMELTVEKGVGYVPTEERGKDESEIGVISIDSIFTPVVNVGLKVEETRVGKKTDYDKIILDIETDGTISPEEAVLKAAEILTNQFSWIAEGGHSELEEVDAEEPVDGEKIERAMAIGEDDEEKNENNTEENTEESAEDKVEDAEEEEKPKRGRPKTVKSQKSKIKS